MEKTQTNISPLSPYLWDAVHRLIVPPGSKIGKVADFRRAISDLGFNFDLLVKQRVDPFPHPVYKAFQTHALHTKALNKRQFDVMRYGMVIDETQRLVLVPAPRTIADTGSVVARQFEGIYNDRLDSTEVSQHTLMPEYSFLVLQLPAKAEEMPNILFRMVFRNEAYNEESVRFMCQQFPLFRLRAVFVSNSVYDELQKVFQYRETHAGVYVTEEGKVLGDPKVERVFEAGQLKHLCDTWLTVLNGIAPAYVKEKGIGPDVVGLFLRTHRAMENGTAVQDRSEDYQTPQVDNLVRLSYLHNEERMKKRVEVIARTRGLLNRWRDGEFDLPYFEEELDDAEPGVSTAQAARIIMKLTREGTNNMVNREICAYVPLEHEYKQMKVYRTPAAEHLRLWVLKGLMAAEIHGVHVVLVDIDAALLLFQCVGLLWGEGEDQRSKEYVFHVCKIVVETVEDYVQHSGVIWKAIILLSDQDNVKAEGLCKDILEVVQKAKRHVEIKEREKEDMAEKEAAERARRRELLEDHVRQRAEAQREANGQLVEHCSAGKNALVPYTETLVNGPSTIPEAIIKSAERSGVHIDDKVLYPLFESLCEHNVPLAPVHKVVSLLLSKLSKNDEKSEFWPHDHPLLSLDNCGVPCDEQRVFDFVMGFCLKTPKAASFDEEPQQGEEDFKLNYIEFSMMMLALAKL